MHSIKTLSIHNWPFIIGEEKHILDHMVDSVHNHNGDVFLAGSLNDLALADKPEFFFWYKTISAFTTDGMPLVFFAQQKTKSHVDRVYGPSVLYKLCQRTPKMHHLFLGPSQHALTKLLHFFEQHKVQFAKTTTIVVPKNVGNIQQLLHRVHASKPDVIWVGIGSPYQAYLATQIHTLVPNTSIVCVGAAFEILSGVKKIAPTWIQKLSLEWAYRLVNEPRRLWRRYLIDIPLFLIDVLFGEMFSYKRTK